MGMICYCNGSLAREKIRDELNGESQSHDWTKFNEALLNEKLPNNDEVGIYFPLGEIVPSVNAVYKRAKFNVDTGKIEKIVDSFSDKRHDAKNIVESQALSCRVRISPLITSEVTSMNSKNENVKVKFDYDEIPLREYFSKRPNKAFFVGGASKNDAIVKKFAQVIGATDGNYRLETPNSCALGGCYKAAWSDLYQSRQTDQRYDQFLNDKFPWEDLEYVCDSDAKAWQHYNHKILPLSQLEATLN